MSYYNNYDNDWSNVLFISNPEDLKKEIKLEDIGKEIFCLTKHAFCETCNKTLKAYGSDTKAQAQVDKHLSYKKYASHKAFVKTIEFPSLSKCTTADVLGTKANIDRNNALRETFYAGVKSKIEQEIASYETTIAKVQKAFNLPNRDNDIPRCPQELADAEIRLSSEECYVFARIKVSDFKSLEELFAGTWGRENSEFERDCYERASMMIHYIKLEGRINRHDVYSWEYPIVYDDFVGFDVELEKPCLFCEKKITTWNDAFDGEWRKAYVHRGCYKHYREQKALNDYAEKYAKKLEQEVTTS